MGVSGFSYPRCLVWALLAGSVAASLPAQAQLKFVETPELKVVYYDPATAYQVPTGLRAYLGALDADRELFG